MTAIAERLGTAGPHQDAGTVGGLLAWTFGLAPPLLFVLTWSEDFAPLQQMSRAYALPILASQLVVVLVSFREGFGLGRPRWLPTALVSGLLILAWGMAGHAQLLMPSLLRTGIWTLQLAFALAVVNLWHNRMLDLEQWRTAILTGLLLVFLLLFAFVATTEHSPDERVWRLPAFGNVRWFGYLAAGAIGLAAPGFLQGSKIAWAVAATAYASAFWTGSRGPILAAVVGLALSTIFIREFRRLRVWVSFAACAIVGALLAWVLGALVAFEAHGSGSAMRFDDSGRIDVWRDTIDAISMRPWVGWGEAQFREIFRGVWPVAQPHNVVLQVLLAWGLIGALLCLALALWTTPRFLKAQSIDAAPFQCAALMLAVYSMYDGALYYAHSLSLFVFCVAAAMAAGSPRAADAAIEQTTARPVV
jgi:O-antigen ligase